MQTDQDRQDIWGTEVSVCTEQHLESLYKMMAHKLSHPAKSLRYQPLSSVEEWSPRPSDAWQETGLSWGTAGLGPPSWTAPAAWLPAEPINSTLLTTFTCLFRSSRSRCEQACSQVVWELGHGIRSCRRPSRQSIATSVGSCLPGYLPCCHSCDYVILLSKGAWQMELKLLINNLWQHKIPHKP